MLSIAIPISIVATFNLMYFNNLTLNIMTLGRLALGAECLLRQCVGSARKYFPKAPENGMSARDAAIQGTAEVGGAISASTLTTIVVATTLLFIFTALGELFKDQAWTVAFSLLSSLFVAIFVIQRLSPLLQRASNTC